MTILTMLIGIYVLSSFDLAAASASEQPSEEGNKKRVTRTSRSASRSKLDPFAWIARRGTATNDRIRDYITEVVSSGPLSESDTEAQMSILKQSTDAIAGILPFNKDSMSCYLRACVVELRFTSEALFPKSQQRLFHEIKTRTPAGVFISSPERTAQGQSCLLIVENIESQREKK